MAGHQALPSTLERSPEDAQRAWLRAHDDAVRQYGEGRKADRTAYGALKDSYRKVGHRWERKEGQTARGGVAEAASKQELYGVARQMDIEGRSRMTKAELLDAIHARESTRSPRHDELPLADYDHLPIGSLEHRIRSLHASELKTLLAYEREHANRAPVVRILRARLDQLRAGAKPSHGGDRFRPEQPAAPHAGSKVTPATSPQPIHPPLHGTPAQSGKPKADHP
ncbi:ChaB family protein [Streptomyces sp. NPDC059373]